jgi:hypothetical protein
MRATPLARVLLLGAALAACDQPAPTAPTPPNPPDSPNALLGSDAAGIFADLGVPLLQPGDGERAVTAGATFFVGAPEPAQLALSAVRHRDGSYSGSYVYRDQVVTPESVGFEEFRLQGRTLCFFSDGLNASIVMDIRQSSPAATAVGFPVGNYAILGVTDPGTPNDQDFSSSIFFLPPDPSVLQVYCSQLSLTGYLPVIRGEIQIH